MWGPFARRTPDDARIEVGELRVTWALLVAGTAIGAWMTPWEPGQRDPTWTLAGAALLVPGVLLALAAVRASAGRSLATHGPYRFVRHPYSLAILLLLAGAIVALRSLAALVLFIPAVRVTIERARREEHNLVLRLGDAYHAYQRRVPFMLPLAPPLPPGGMDAERDAVPRRPLGLDDDESEGDQGEDEDQDDPESTTPRR